MLRRLQYPRPCCYAIARDSLQASKLKVISIDVMRSESGQRGASCGAGRKQNEETRRVKDLQGREELIRVYPNPAS